MSARRHDGTRVPRGKEGDTISRRIDPSLAAVRLLPLPATNRLLLLLLLLLLPLLFRLLLAAVPRSLLRLLLSSRMPLHTIGISRCRNIPAGMSKKEIPTLSIPNRRRMDIAARTTIQMGMIGDSSFQSSSAQQRRRETGHEAAATSWMRRGPLRVTRSRRCRPKKPSLMIAHGGVQVAMRTRRISAEGIITQHATVRRPKSTVDRPQRRPRTPLRMAANGSDTPPKTPRIGIAIDLTAIEGEMIDGAMTIDETTIDERKVVERKVGETNEGMNEGMKKGKMKIVGIMIVITRVWPMSGLPSVEKRMLESNAQSRMIGRTTAMIGVDLDIHHHRVGAGMAGHRRRLRRPISPSKKRLRRRDTLDRHLRPIQQRQQ